MTTMQQFYNTYIFESSINLYRRLSEANLVDIPLDDLLEWNNW